MVKNNRMFNTFSSENFVTIGWKIVRHVSKENVVIVTKLRGGSQLASQMMDDVRHA